MLALSLLVTSKSHVFVSFFKIFFMICVFGLFHGLVLLPAVLCLVGPTDEEPKDKMKSGKKDQVNGHGPKTSQFKDSEKYLRENEQNLQTENQEQGVPLTHDMTQSLQENNLRETVLV